ncbi:MAG TPA: response regulator [Candidatus Angelobacter sp.]|nr:response regulator [Candidatus Angelobacter sp.]
MTTPTILIIEDNPLNVELATDLLVAAGFRIHSTNTAEDGLRRVRELLPDLVLMDIGLPGMDGLCATRTLKNDPATAGICIVGLTAHAMKGDESIAIHAGCDGYLTKPIDTRTFVPAIKDFIATHTNQS